MRLCAVIPAAGRGSRLGLDKPKILTPVQGTRTIWDFLKEKLNPVVDQIHLILSPDGARLFAHRQGEDPRRISTSVQREPKGMGDAIFGSFESWQAADAILVIWGDQLHVSAQTLEAIVRLHEGAEQRLVLPLTPMAEPYVEYRFDSAGKLCAILQSREGDRCASGGLGDVGTFLLSTHGLREAWLNYAATADRGTQTGEMNFLPFLTWLSQSGWEVRRHEVDDPIEARGINTPEDLEFFRRLYDRANSGRIGS